MPHLRQSLNLEQTQTQEEVKPDELIWLDLGWFGYGIRNESGYSKEFISVGTRLGDSAYGIVLKGEFKIDTVRITERFYYTNSQEPHHEDESYFEWNGNIADYINKKRRNKYA